MKTLRGDYATLTTMELVPTGTKLLNTEADETLIPTSLQPFSQGMLVLCRAGNWRQGDFGSAGWATPLPPQGPKACCLKNSVVWNHIRPCIPHSHLQLWWSLLSSCPPGPLITEQCCLLFLQPHLPSVLLRYCLTASSTLLALLNSILAQPL